MILHFTYYDFFYLFLFFFFYFFRGLMTGLLIHSTYLPLLPFSYPRFFSAF